MSLERGTVEGQTPGRRPDRVAAVRLLVLVSAISSWVLAGSASADDTTFHRTTPRAAFDGTGAALVIGVPGGRAWGIESDLRPLPAPGTSVYVRLAVTDGAVREAFVRVAYYASADKRCPRGRKCCAVRPYAARKRWACPPDLNPCIHRSRWRVG